MKKKDITIDNIQFKYRKNLVTIVNSYLITNKQQMKQILKRFKKETKFKTDRDINSWVREWRAHNRLYKMGLFKSHTTNTDLENNISPFLSIIYFMLGW